MEYWDDSSFHASFFPIFGTDQIWAFQVVLRTHFLFIVTYPWELGDL